MTLFATNFFPTIPERNQGISQATQDFLRSTIQGFNDVNSLTSVWQKDILETLAEAPPGFMTADDMIEAYELMAGVYFDTKKDALMVRSFLAGVGIRFTSEIKKVENGISIRTYFKKGDLDGLMSFFGDGPQPIDSLALVSVDVDKETGLVTHKGLEPSFFEPEYSPDITTTEPLAHAALIVDEVGNVIDQIRKEGAIPSSEKRPASVHKAKAEGTKHIYH